MAIPKSLKEISEATFRGARAKALSEIAKDPIEADKNLTWIETEDEFVYHGWVYRNTFGTYEKGKVVM